MTSAAYQLVADSDFGFLRISPTPSAEEITRFYAEEFYSGDYKRFNDSALEVHLEDREFHEGQWGDMRAHMARLLGRGLEGGSLLDVGCGWAQALLYFQRHGLRGFGFDPAPEAVAYARAQGLDVVQAGMERMAVFGDRRFDVVTLLNVLEHLADPAAVLREIREAVIRPDGLLVIDVPNEFNAFQICAREVHGLPEWWVAPPGHLNYFSPDTLTRLLEGTGFRVVLLEASFPMELFLLFGDNYVGDGALGKACHQRRVAFELNMRRHGKPEVLSELYQALAKLGLGRQVVAYAVPAGRDA